MDTSFWQSIVTADYQVPEGSSAETLTPELLEMLGSTDPVLRDDFAYPILAYWIERGLYSPDELRTLGEQMVNNLQQGLGEYEGDRVFLRSFSTLILNCVIEYDNENPFLQEAELHEWLAASLDYLGQEHDLRGYVAEKGWAHSAAHTADLMMVLARHHALGKLELERILIAIAAKVNAHEPFVYLYREDERLAYAVLMALRRDLLEPDFLTAWLENLVHPEGRPTPYEATHDPADNCALVNTTMFLRSLYFQSLLTENPPSLDPELIPALLEALKALDTGFYQLP